MRKANEWEKNKTIILPQKKVKKFEKDEPTILLGNYLRILLIRE
jgi:hypothetical protein